MTEGGKETTMPDETDKELLAMRDIADGLLESADGVDLGRVSDIEIVLDGDGTPRLTALLVGPEALAGRVSSHLHPLARWVFRGRFDHQIPLEEVEEFGPTLKLRHVADHYSVGHADDWIYQHILRFIPGSGQR
jgi:hypothetical protein